TAEGQLIVSTDAMGDYAALDPGSVGQVLAINNSGDPEWEDVGSIPGAPIANASAAGSGSADYTTSSTTFVDIDGTNLKVQPSVATNDVLLISFTAVGSGPGGGPNLAATLNIGGTVLGDTLGLMFTGSTQANIAFTVLHTVTSGEISSGTVLIK